MSDLLTVRYPSGQVEHRTIQTAPAVGDILNRNGDAWIIDHVAHADDGTSVVTLRPGPEPEEREERS